MKFLLFLKESVIAFIAFMAVGFLIRFFVSVFSGPYILFSNDGSLGILNSEWYGFKGHEFPNGSVTVYFLVIFPLVVGRFLGKNFGHLIP